MGPHRITPDDRAPLVKIIAGIMMTYMILCYFARLVMRFTINGPFGKDDWTVTVGTIFAAIHSALKLTGAEEGLGQRRNNIPSENIFRIEKLEYAGDIMYIIALMLSKASTSLLVSRLTRQKKHLRAACVGTCISIVWGIVSVFVLAIRCDLSQPWSIMDPECSQTVWTTPFLLDPNCDRGPDKSLQYSRWLVVEVTGVAVEIFLVWLPIYLTWGLQMPLKSKLLVISAFSFRLPVIIISGVRTYYLHRDISSDDILFSTADSSVWMEISLHYGLIAATIPCLKPFIKAFNTGYLSQRGGSSEYGMHDPNSYVLSNISVGSESRGRDRMLFSRANNNRSKTPITLDIQGHHRDQGSNSPSAERRYRTYHINPTTKGFDHSGV